eukprot:CAMPEP_0117649562 /NCGR_PEP_ID=MMETSP0804-20121206/1042_1 /TAXON_ID=1074897 /ORGANISM="Tetraselmis astigmatica, Strain CCMP880" /LENGTH=415 /DNA_ID=CAMNT_0005455315 /DNA_START=268 /DNA_END=1515 /DNA_ORIENTATION=+
MKYLCVRLSSQLLLWHAFLLLGDPTPTSSRAVQRKSSYRVWFDERKFKSGEIDLVREAFEAAGAEHVGGPANKRNQTLGYQAQDEWDLLWTVSKSAHRAMPYLAGWQRINLIPGLTAVTKKDQLVRSASAAFGEHAMQYMPASFLLPDDLAAWKAWKDPECPHDKNTSCLWVLKTNQHLGAGIEVLERHEAERVALLPNRTFVLAQKYIAKPLLIDGHKVGVRLWAVITSTTPLRSYLHRRGLVFFSSNKFSEGKADSSGHLTNAFRNMEGQVWTLEDLKDSLGLQAYLSVWSQMKDISGLLLASALTRCRTESHNLHLRPGSAFQLLGLDFLISEDGKAWLLEINATPSTSLHGANKVGISKLRNEKSAMLFDLTQLAGPQQIREDPGTGECRNVWYAPPPCCLIAGFRPANSI